MFNKTCIVFNLELYPSIIPDGKFTVVLSGIPIILTVHDDRLTSAGGEGEIVILVSPTDTALIVK